MPTLMADGRVALLDLRTKRPLHVLPARDGTPAEALAMFAGGRRLASGGTAGTVTIWDLPTRTVVRRLRFLEPVWATAVSPDETLIAVLRQAESGADVHVEVRDLASDATRYTRTIRFGPGGVAFSADGSTLIASGCCEDGATVTGWDARSGAQRFHSDVPQVANAFAVSPAGRTLALGTGDGRVLVLDAHTGALRSQVKVSAGDIQQIVFSPDGRLIAASSASTGITLWDIRSGKRIGGQFPRIPGWIAGMLFQPDGHLVLFEQDIMVEWPTDTPTLKRYACRIAGRDLTRQEWSQLLPNRPYRSVCRN